MMINFLHHKNRHGRSYEHAYIVYNNYLGLSIHIFTKMLDIHIFTKMLDIHIFAKKWGDYIKIERCGCERYELQLEIHFAHRKQQGGAGDMGEFGKVWRN